MWKLKVNLDKTKITILKEVSSKSQNVVFRYDGKELNIASIFNHLEIDLSSNDTMKDCRDNLLDRGRKVMFTILKIKQKGKITRYPNRSISQIGIPDLIIWLGNGLMRT